jgi:hypothetical protein
MVSMNRYSKRSGVMPSWPLRVVGVGLAVVGLTVLTSVLASCKSTGPCCTCTYGSSSCSGQTVYPAGSSDWDDDSCAEMCRTSPGACPLISSKVGDCSSEPPSSSSDASAGPQPDLPRSGQPCDPTGACAIDYECRNGICWYPGGNDNPCLPGDVCLSEDSACLGSSAGYCPQQLSTCCQRVGGEDEPCRPGNICDHGLTCIDEPDFCYFRPHCCQVAGGLSQPCAPGGVCEAPYECHDGVCVHVGRYREPCRAGNTCDEGWVCQDAFFPTCPMNVKPCCTAMD